MPRRSSRLLPAYPVRFARTRRPLNANHSLAEAAKRVPKGVVCLASALAYHELTDQLPHAVWMAIGTRDWMPKEGRPEMRIVRFTGALLTDDVLTVHIENVPVKVFGVAKTIADCFRHRRKVGQTVALVVCRRRSGSERRTPPRSPGMRSVAASPRWSARISRRSPPMPREVKNIGASVRAGLLRISKEKGQNFDLVLTHYAIKRRTLFRTSSGTYSVRIIRTG